MAKLNTTNFPGGISTTEYVNATRLLGVLTGAVNAGQQTFNVADRTSGFTRESVRFVTLTTIRWRSTAATRGELDPIYRSTSGLRWEYISPITERDGLGLLPTDTSLDVLNDPNAVLDFAGAGTDRPLSGKDLNNFAPNFSVAWDPFKDGKTSIRGRFRHLLRHRQQRDGT